ncbi:MAG: hypothetical protein HY017_27575 [Betaproteobacteria bacterium]|nr:hypothetical protein [Betaproteobacteria bacterium]
MTGTLEGGNRIVDASVEGSVFPENEAEIDYPVLIDSTREGKSLHISGSVYGRALVLRGDVWIGGPVISRGDTRVEPSGGWIRLLGGITVNGSLNAKSGNVTSASSAPASLQGMSMLVKGDINVNQSLYLSGAIVFGSIRATNCKLENCVVLGTVVANEKLTVSMSTIAGYAAADVAFEGNCAMIYAIGESSSRPSFVPHEGMDGQVTPPDIRFYPSFRHVAGLVNIAGNSSVRYPDQSKLDFDSDWVSVQASPNAAIDESEEIRFTKWVLSLGGRIGDLRKLQAAVEAMTAMLKCGFEFEHYHPLIRQSQLNGVVSRLTPEEGWILSEVCR